MASVTFGCDKRRNRGGVGGGDSVRLEHHVVLAMLLSIAWIAPRVHAQVIDPGVSYLHHDHDGHLVALTDAGGAVIRSVTPEPFGDGASERFLGEDRQTSSSPGGGLYVLGERGYYPRLGRFLSPDAQGLAAVDRTDPAALNRYAYALNNPYVHQDPSGLSPETARVAADGVVHFVALNPEFRWRVTGDPNGYWDSSAFLYGSLRNLYYIAKYDVVTEATLAPPLASLAELIGSESLKKAADTLARWQFRPKKADDLACTGISDQAEIALKEFLGSEASRSLGLTVPLLEEFGTIERKGTILPQHTAFWIRVAGDDRDDILVLDWHATLELFNPQRSSRQEFCDGYSHCRITSSVTVNRQ